MILAIFDFCETIIKYQTADRFVDFVYVNAKIKSRFWFRVSEILCNRYLGILMGKLFPKMNFGKRVKLLRLKGIDTADFETLSIQYAQKIKNDTIPEIIEKILWHKSQGHFLLLVSGGYESYLKHFKEILGFSDILGTKIKQKENKVSGIFEGEDCMFEEKVFRINELLSSLSENLKDSYCYTDSITDLPILNYSKHPFVVSVFTTQKWAQELHFEQIIWK